MKRGKHERGKTASALRRAGKRTEALAFFGTQDSIETEKTSSGRRGRGISQETRGPYSHGYGEEERRWKGGEKSTAKGLGLSTFGGQRRSDRSRRTLTLVGTWFRDKNVSPSQIDSKGP